MWKFLKRFKVFVFERKGKELGHEHKFVIVVRHTEFALVWVGVTEGNGKGPKGHRKGRKRERERLWSKGQENKNKNETKINNITAKWVRTWVLGGVWV